MDIPLNSQDQANKPNGKEQFKQGPSVQNIPTEGLSRPMTKAEEDAEKNRLTKLYKEDLPFLRMQAEYQELIIKVTEQQVLLGSRPINTIKGLLGAELAMREIKAITFMTEFQNHVDNMQRKEQEQNQKQAQSQMVTDNTPSTIADTKE